MRFNCNYDAASTPPARRRGLTLIELVIVLAILVALAGMVAPLIEGLATQTNSSTNATVVDDVNRAIGTYCARHETMPSGWDSLLNTSGTLYGKLHANLTDSTTPLLQISELTSLQADSLTSAGVASLADAEESGTPNAFPMTIRNVAAGGKVVSLITTTGSFSDDRFNIGHLQAVDTDNQYLIFGLGGSTTIRGSAMRDVPLISSADPNSHYARVLCVFMVPGTGSNAVSFPAQYIGCFLPDGTSQRMNLDRYNNAKTAD